MEYFTDVLDRRTGTITTVSAGDWITITELGELFGVGQRRVRTVLRHLDVLAVEGAGAHQRHRLTSWVVQREWGRRVEKRGTVPFDVVGPDLRQWVAARWEGAVADLSALTTRPVTSARLALNEFNANRRRGPLTVQEAVSWLADYFPELTQTEIAIVLDVTQQLVAKYLAFRRKQRDELRRLRDMDPNEHMQSNGGEQGCEACRVLPGHITQDYNLLQEGHGSPQ